MRVTVRRDERERDTWEGKRKTGSWDGRPYSMKGGERVAITMCVCVCV